MVLKIRCSIWKSKLMAFCLGYLPFKGGKRCIFWYTVRVFTIHFPHLFLVYRFWSSKTFFKWRTAWKAVCLGNTSCAWMPLLLFLLLKKAEGEIIVHRYPFKNGTSLECHRSWMRRQKKKNCEQMAHSLPCIFPSISLYVDHRIKQETHRINHYMWNQSSQSFRKHKVP